MSDTLPDRKHLKRVPVWIPSDQRVVYFVTACCAQRRKVFTNNLTVKIALESLIKHAATTEWSVPQVCFMPDHVHLMLLPTRDREQQLSKLGKASKVRSYYKKTNSELVYSYVKDVYFMVV